MRMRAMIGEASQLVSRVRDAQGKLRGAAGSEAEKAKALGAIASRLLTEPVRYGKPGLQAHILYLAGMTGGVDQKIGRDAVERYQVLRRELDSLRADPERTLGPGNRCPMEGGSMPPISRAVRRSGRDAGRTRRRRREVFRR